MSFENDYNSFISALVSSDARKAEEIISQCDNKRDYLRKALNDIGGEKLESISLQFRGNGIKRQVYNVINDYY